MTFPFRALCATGLAVIFASCVTTPEVPVVREVPHGGPKLQTYLEHASGIYLVKVKRSGGRVDTLIEEVWRHDPRRGPAPAPGSRIDLAQSRPTNSPHDTADALVVFQMRPPHRMGDGRLAGDSIASVQNGFVSIYQVSVSDLKKVVAAAAYQPSSAPRIKRVESSWRRPADWSTRPHPDQVPRLISSVAPTYPLALREAEVEGEAILDVLITKEGDVTDVHLRRATDQRFADAAMAVITQWKFSPALRNGEAVDWPLIVPVNFTLRDRSRPAADSGGGR